MNKHNSCIYLFCRFPFFNPGKTPLFDSFTPELSCFLYSSLLLNYREILESLPPAINHYYCFEEADKDFIPPELISDNIIWRSSREISDHTLFMNEKYFSGCNNNIIIMADSIGISEKDISKILNLLSIEDDSIVLGKTYSNKLSLIGFNSLDEKFFNEFDWNDLVYDNALNIACKQNSHLHVVNNFILLEGLPDFKQLYAELSKKESLAYCSHQMHEKFTHLFIEYKELLK